MNNNFNGFGGSNKKNNSNNNENQRPQSPQYNGGQRPQNLQYNGNQQRQNSLNVNNGRLSKQSEVNTNKNTKVVEDVADSYYRHSIDRLRVILMFFMCIQLLGFPTAFGRYVQTICGFAPIAFFITEGYLVLREDEDRSARILRAIKRTAITFGILAVLYFLLNLIPVWIAGDKLNYQIFSSGSFWFNFLVMNVWPFGIGSPIWYVQALLYAYIIIFVFDKLKLLKIDWLIIALCLLFTVITGELAGIFKFDIYGYNYVPGNFLTRALPYVLLGGFIHKNMRDFIHIRSYIYIWAIPVGIFLIILEIMLLDTFNVPGYYGHLLGMPVIAVSACMLAFKDRKGPLYIEDALSIRRHDYNIIYYICQPVGAGILLLLTKIYAPTTTLINELNTLLASQGENSDAFQEKYLIYVEKIGKFQSMSGFVGIFTFIVCLVITLLFVFIRKMIKEVKKF